MEISLKQQLAMCETQIHLQTELVKVFDVDDAVSTENLEKDLRTMEAIRNTIQIEYLLEQMANRLTKCEGAK